MQPSNLYFKSKTKSETATRLVHVLKERLLPDIQEERMARGAGSLEFFLAVLLNSSVNLLKKNSFRPKKALKLCVHTNEIRDTRMFDAPTHILFSSGKPAKTITDELMNNQRNHKKKGLF